MPSRTKYPHGHQKEGEGECQLGFARREPTAAGEPEKEEKAGRRFAEHGEDGFSECADKCKLACGECKRCDKAARRWHAAALEPALEAFGRKGAGDNPRR